jgi:hypothetical protein
MQISLRKANALQVAINEALKGLEFKAEIAINEFQKPEATIEAASKTFFANVDRRGALLRSLYEIRKATAAANAASDIDNRLADIALLEKDFAFFSGQAKVKERLDAEVINGKIVKIANRSEDSYYAKAEVETSIFTTEDIKNLNNQAVKAKKAKQKLQDELLELNVRTTITLSDEAVATLTAEDII